MRKKDWLKAVCLLAALMMLCAAAAAESYSAGTMRLLRFQGEVGITDATGSERFVMENARFSSGETMRTGSSSSASVSLDSSKIVSLDEITTVGFTQAGSALTLTLKEGTLFLDVSKKLDENESLDIETSTMTIGIRGTILFVIEHPEETVLGVLEGTAEADIKDGSGKKIPVPAGQILRIPAMDQPRDMVPGDLGDFIWQQVQTHRSLVKRVQEVLEPLHEHTPGKTLRFNYVAPSCRSEGSYTQEVRCELCGKTLSRQDKTVKALEHHWETGSRYAEETTAAYVWGHYEVCSVCGATRKVVEGTDPY
ncbi:MAG: FecR domain-containing protein [Clostridia bacterium]|nr:FecR domain-containing protein [Clostridia bacterium]